MVLIDSMPPASTTFAAPACSSRAANITVRMPDGQAMLMVTTGEVSGMPPRTAAIAVDHLVDGGGLQSAALDGGANRRGAEVIGRHVAQGAAETSDGGPYRRDGDDIIGACHDLSFRCK